ncbi:MAG: FAD-dependent monooxygenase, partial [Fimbriimonadaceae bacterium]|nr:FAD-dependent monooxygenase [Alphaproteobacteria bacterium]
MKKQNPAHDITVYERNKAGDTFGWGVVFSDATLQNFAEADPETKTEIINSLAHWDDIDVIFKGRTITSGGHGFCGIGRKKLLQILQARCIELGVNMAFETDVESVEQFPDADLIIAGDGIFSKIRAQHADVLKPEIEVRANRFTWLGTHKLFEAFTFIFVETEHGWFQAHAYRFDDNTSTFIIETREETWRASGIENMSKEDGIAYCEKLFAPWLDGNELISNATHLRGSAAWINFNRVHNNVWSHNNVVLMGDAAHTAHFSIGSGTKLAMEDAISLARHFKEMEGQPIKDVLKAYQEEREVDVFRIQSAARNSTEWFEHIDRYAKLEPEQFAYALLTRSQRVSHENLRLRDKGYLESAETWFYERAAGHAASKPVPPMFAPFSLRGMTLENRVVMSPMAMYSAVDGIAGDFHMVHLSSRAIGGTGLIYTEMTAPSPDSRITPGCAGIWNDEQVAAWKRIVDFIHANSKAKVCLQIGHSGRKGSTKIGWEGVDQPLADGNWDIMSASPIPWSPENQVPREMARGDMDRLRDDFVASVKRADEAGFDMIELHAAHGYLIASFISPLTNVRSDDYGGSLENRMRYPL